MTQPTSRHIVISDEEHQLPYSKGLMAASIMATGLAPARAFFVAERVEQQLHDHGVLSLTRAELQDVTRRVLVDEVGERYAESYAKWQLANRLDRPLVILIGGATGVGKSTIATQLAARLGLTRIIPTDAVREVMRSMLSEDMLPALHTSSFDAASVARRSPLPPSADPVIIGYREQSAAVAVGVRALVRRAIMERTDVILEGAHIAPGFLDLDEFEGAVVVPFVVTVDDEELHRSHFILRAHESRGRPYDRYSQHFGNIRKIQRYVKSLAMEHGMPIIPSYNLDATLAQVIELVVTEATRAVQAEPVPQLTSTK
jgi:2-phosphoglycerate kinase